jgi:hypothetical protein
MHLEDFVCIDLLLRQDNSYMTVYGVPPLM